MPAFTSGLQSMQPRQWPPSCSQYCPSLLWQNMASWEYQPPPRKTNTSDPPSPRSFPTDTLRVPAPMRPPPPPTCPRIASPLQKRPHPLPRTPPPNPKRLPRWVDQSMVSKQLYSSSGRHCLYSEVLLSVWFWYCWSFSLHFARVSSIFSSKFDFIWWSSSIFLQQVPQSPDSLQKSFLHWLKRG